MVRKRILVSMRFFLIWRADSNDDNPGMPISISTMSGRSSRAFSTASPPSAASPITSKSLSLSNRRRTPWRNSVWSSTSKHLIFGMRESFSLIRPVSGICRLRQRAFHDLRRLTRRHIYFDARSFAFGRDHARNPAQHCNPFLDSGQPKRLIARAGPRLNPNSIVFHGDLHHLVVARHLHGHALGVGVLGHVVQCLLHHAIDGLLGARRQAAHIVRNYHPRFYAGVFGELIGFFADRGHQSQFLQHQRGKLANNSPDPFNGAIHHVDGLDRKSTRLNSSHTVISYAVFCLKKKKTYHHPTSQVLTD